MLPSSLDRREGVELEPTACSSVSRPTFAEVYEQCFRFVWRTMRRLGVSEAEIDDAVQDVFVVVHRRLADFRPGAPVRHWVFRIASRIARDHRRSVWRRNPLRHGFERAEFEVDGIAGGQQNPEESAEALAAARLVERILDELSYPKREVFVLAELEQMSAPEIASALDVPLNTVYSRLRVARAEFEEALARRRGVDGRGGGRVAIQKGRAP